MAGYTLIALPLAIILLAFFKYQEIQPTLSHYYFFEEHPGLIRTMFTGFLILVGGVMIAYRGFDNRDNWIHNLAGFFALCVAAFPKLHDAADRYYTTGLLSGLHGPSAALLFCLAAYAVWYCGGNSFKSRLNSSELRILEVSKWTSLGTMLSGIGIYIAFLVFGKIFSLPNVGIITVELLGFFGFASHWLVMTRVISTANTRKATSRVTHQDHSALLQGDVHTRIVPTIPGLQVPAVTPPEEDFIL